MIIDTGTGAEALVPRRNFDAIDASPTRTIVLTQAHTDHVGGVHHLRDPGTHVSANARLEGPLRRSALTRRSAIPRMPA